MKWHLAMKTGGVGLVFELHSKLQVAPIRGRPTVGHPRRGERVSEEEEAERQGRWADGCTGPRALVPLHSSPPSHLPGDGGRARKESLNWEGLRWTWPQRKTQRPTLLQHNYHTHAQHSYTPHTALLAGVSSLFWAHTFWAKKAFHPKHKHTNKNTRPPRPARCQPLSHTHAHATPAPHDGAAPVW